MNNEKRERSKELKAIVYTRRMSHTFSLEFRNPPPTPNKTCNQKERGALEKKRTLNFFFFLPGNILIAPFSHSVIRSFLLTVFIVAHNFRVCVMAAVRL